MQRLPEEGGSRLKLFHKKKKQNNLPPAHFLWWKNMYLGDGVARKAKKLRRAVDEGERRDGLWILAIPSNENNNLDMIRAEYLIQPWYRERELRIVGMAGDREEAERVLLDMVCDCLRVRGDADLRRWLLDRIGEEGYL